MPTSRTLIRTMDSMDISIAWLSISSLALGRRRSSRHDEGEPRFGELELRGVDGVRDFARAIGLRCLAHGETGGDLLQRVARGDLRLVAAVGELPRRRDDRRRSRGRVFHLQHFQPRTVDGLERQLRLEALCGRRVELPRGLEGAVAVDFGAVTLETERATSFTAGLKTCATSGRRTCATQVLQPLTAGRAKDFRAFAFELPAWEGDPV